MKNVNPITLALIVIFFSLLNVAVFGYLLKRSMAWYEVHKAKWMPCTGFCVFFWAALFEVGAYLLSYPPVDIFNLGLIISIALCSAVISSYLLGGKK